MSLNGQGAVAIWHDLDPAARDEFYQWHGREHMPERMAIPGFRRGRRYRVVGEGPEFFNLYEADNLAVLAGPDYLARLDAPTPWTRAVVAHFRDVARSACAVRWSAGVGEGGWLRTLRFDAADRLDAVVAGLPGVAARSGIAGVHLLVDDTAISGIATRERAARGEAADVPPHIVLIEGVGRAQVEAAGSVVAAGVGVAVTAATYSLEHATESDRG